VVEELMTDLSHARVQKLRELIEAIDERAPQVLRVGESAIANDAAALKTRALERIAELELGSVVLEPAALGGKL
jgi:hypothetical protein